MNMLARARAHRVAAPAAGVFLIGAFHNPKTGAHLPLAELRDRLEFAGVSVQTYSFNLNEAVDFRIDSSTPLRAKRSHALLDRNGIEDAAAIIFGAEYLLNPGPVPRLRHTREQMRRISLLKTISAKNDVNFLLGGNAVVSRLLTPRKGFVPKSKESERLNQVASVAGAVEALSQHLGDDFGRTETLGGLRGKRKMSRQNVLTALDHGAWDETSEEELRNIADIAGAHALRQHPIIMRLRAQYLDQPSIVAEPAPHRAIDIANEPLNGSSDITRYQAHLAAAYKLTDCGTETEKSRQALRTWYHSQAAERVPAFWVPEPSKPAKNDIDETANPNLARAFALAEYLNFEHQSPMTEDHERYFGENPFGPGPSRLAVLLYILSGQMADITALHNIWSDDTVSEWFVESVIAQLPKLASFSNDAIEEQEEEPFTPQVIGLPNSQTGLGTNLRMTAQMLRLIDMPHDIVDMDAQYPRERHTPIAIRPPKRPFVIHHINADRVPQTILSPEFAFRNDIFHIGYLLWELDKVPDAHRLTLDLLDEIWVPSQFVANTYQKVAKTPIRIVRKGLPQLGTLSELPEDRPLGSEGKFRVLISFDYHSSVERKNPVAGLRAFQTAFPRDSHPDCELVIKTTPGASLHWGDPQEQMAEIRKATESDPRITLVETMMPNIAFWRFLKGFDVLFSPHRAEGFGYLPAFALCAGVPTIATDYGGSQDFLSSATGYPIGYSLVDTPKGHAIFDTEAAQWAEIDIEAAAKALKSVRAEPEAASAKARFARSFMRRMYSMDAYSARCEALLKENGLIT